MIKYDTPVGIQWESSRSPVGGNEKMCENAFLEILLESSRNPTGLLESIRNRWGSDKYCSQWVLPCFSISVTTHEDSDTGIWQNQELKVKTCYHYSWDCQEVLWAIGIRQPTTENPRIRVLGTETWWAGLLRSSDPTIIKVGSKPSELPGICCWPPWFDCEFTNRFAIGSGRISSVTILNFNNQTVHRIHHELSPLSSPQCSSPTKRSLCSQPHCGM